MKRQPWAEKIVTPEGMVGSETYRYNAGDWMVTLSYPIVPPEAVVYQIVMANPVTEFQWEGEVDAAGQVTEMLVARIRLLHLTTMKKSPVDPWPHDVVVVVVVVVVFAA